MQLIGIVLLLISVGLVVGPVGAVVIMYSDNLSGLVIPSELQEAINGNPSFILADNFNSISGDDLDDLLDNIVLPTLVDANINTNSRTFDVRGNVTNFFKQPLTLNEFQAELQTQNGQQLATVIVPNPMNIPSGESSIVTIQGTWTQLGEDFVASHQQDSQVTITLANIIVDVNGVRVERSEPFTVTVPISLSGVNITG